MASGVPAWRRFWLLTTGTTAAIAAVLFVFVAVVDPWDALPLSPALPRVPATSQARYGLPMLARSARFDSAVIGTSTIMLLRPEILDRLFRARFVNLGFYAATAFEQAAMLRAFLQGHAAPKYVLMGMDLRWCDPGPEMVETAEYRFPRWLYERSRWRGYREALTLYGVREAWAELLTLLGRRGPRLGLDGYTNFAIPEQQDDLARARANIARDGVAAAMPDPSAPAVSWPTATLPRLAAALREVPGEARMLLFFVPYARPFQGAPGSPTQRYLAECKRRVVEIARGHANVTVADLMIDSPLTADAGHYYDGMHYRTVVADRVAAALAEAAERRESEDVRLLKVGED